jgi:hypothetical protein
VSTSWRTASNSLSHSEPAVPHSEPAVRGTTPQDAIDQSACREKSANWTKKWSLRIPVKRPALPGRLRRGRCACPPPPLTSRAYRGLRPHCWPLRVCRTRLHFADRFRAGAGRRSGSGWRQGRVRWGRPLLSRPRGAVGPGPAAVESAAASVVALTCGVCVVGGFRWL